MGQARVNLLVVSREWGLGLRERNREWKLLYSWGLYKGYYRKGCIPPSLVKPNIFKGLEQAETKPSAIITALPSETRTNKEGRSLEHTSPE